MADKGKDESGPTSSEYNLAEALARIEPQQQPSQQRATADGDVIVNHLTSQEARARQQVAPKRATLMKLPSLPKALAPGTVSSASGKKFKRPTSPLVVANIGAPINPRQMGDASGDGAGSPVVSPSLSPSPSPSPAGASTTPIGGGDVSSPLQVPPHSYSASPASTPSRTPAQRTSVHGALSPLAEVSPSSTSPSSGAKLRLRNKALAEKIEKAVAEIPKDSPAEELKEYRVVKEYKAKEDTELNLEVGDLIELLEKSAESEFWWYGVSRSWGPNNGSKGFFPKDCVVLETFEEGNDHGDHGGKPFSEPSVVPTVEMKEVEVETFVEEEIANDLPPTVKPGIKVVCVYPYERTKADELELVVNDLIVVLEAPEVQLGPGEKITGWSPTTIVQRKVVTLKKVEVPAATHLSSSPTDAGTQDLPRELSDDAPIKVGSLDKLENTDVPKDGKESEVKLVDETSKSQDEINQQEKAADSHGPKIIEEEHSDALQEATESDRSDSNKESREAADLENAKVLEEKEDPSRESPSLSSSANLEHDTVSVHDSNELSHVESAAEVWDKVEQFMTPEDGHSRDERSNASDDDQHPKLLDSSSETEKDRRPIKKLTKRIMSLPVKANSSLGVLVDEPEKEDDETGKESDQQSGSPTETPNMERRWSFVKQAHSRALSHSDVGSKSMLRLSTPGKWTNSLAPEVASSDQPTTPTTKPWTDAVSPETLRAMDEKEKKRVKTVVELVETERDYVRDLKIIIECFMRPMSDSKFSRNVDALFSNVDELFSINSELLKTFDSQVKASSEFHGVGEIFLELGERHMQKSRNKAIGSRRISDQARPKNLQVPVTAESTFFGFPKIANLFELQELIKHTDENHREYQILKLALETIEAIITQVNDGAKAAEGVRKMVEIQSSFTEAAQQLLTLKKKINIITPTRYLVREDSLNLIRGDSKKGRKLFLFNDLIITARKDWQSKLRLLDQVNLRHCRVSDIVDDNEAVSTMFEIEILPAGSSGGGSVGGAVVRRFLFSCDTPKIKLAWIESYKTVATTGVKKKKFSETVVDGDDDENAPQSTFLLDEEPAEEKIPIGKKLEMFKENAKKALIDEYKAKIADMEAKITQTELANAELTKQSEHLQARLTDTEALLRAAESSKEDLNTQLWIANCSLSESQALVETLKTNVKETVEKRELETVKLNLAHQEAAQQVEALKSEISKIISENNIALQHKDEEIRKIKHEAVEKLEVEKIQIQTELEQKEALLLALETNTKQMQIDYESKLSEVQLKSTTSLEEAKQSMEKQIEELTRTFEINALHAEQESQKTLELLNASFEKERDKINSEILSKDAKIKLLEQELLNDKQRLVSETDALKKKAYQAYDALKKAHTDTKSELTSALKAAKDTELALQGKEEKLREQVNTVTKLELEKQALIAELGRVSANAESSKVEHMKLMESMEKASQERHQVLMRKESEIAEQAQRVAQYSERAKHAEHAADQARAQLADRQMHFEEIVSRLREETSKMRVERARETEQMEQLLQKHSTVSKQLEATRTQLVNMTESKQQLKAEVTQIKELAATQAIKITSISHDLQQCRLALAELEDKYKRQKTRVEESEKSEATLKEQSKKYEEECHNLSINCERMETRSFEMAKAIEQKDFEISELKDSVRRITELAQIQLHQELNDMKERMSREASLRQELLAKENAELQLKLTREVNELKYLKDHEEQIMAGHLELVGRLEKETANSKAGCEKEIEKLKAINEKLDEEGKEKAKVLSVQKKKIKSLEADKEALESRLSQMTNLYDATELKRKELELTLRSQEDDLSYMRNKVSISDKELAAVTNQLHLHCELDKKYTSLRQNSDQISLEVKAKENIIRQMEQEHDRKDKEIAAMQFVIDEIHNMAFAVDISTVPHPRGISPVQNIRIIGLKDDSKVKSVLSRINAISFDYDRIATLLKKAEAQVTDLGHIQTELLQEREIALENVRKMEVKFKEKTKILKAENGALEHQLQTLNQECESLRHSRSIFEKKLLETEKSLNQVALEKASLEHQLAEKTENYQKLKSVHSLAVEEFKKESRAQKHAGVELSSMLNDAKLKLKEMEAENVYLKHLTDELVDAKLKLQAINDVNKSNNALLESDLNKLKQQNDELQRCRSDNIMNQSKVQELEQEIIREKLRLTDCLREKQLELETAEGNMRRKEAEISLAYQQLLETKQFEFDNIANKNQQLIEALEAAEMRSENLRQDLSDLDEKLVHAKAENQVLCSEIVEISRRENALRCKLDIIQSRIVASNQNIQGISETDQAKHELSYSASFALPKQKFISQDAKAAPSAPANDQVLARCQAQTQALVKSTLRMVDGILAKKTLILRKLVSCEKSILALLDSYLYEKLGDDNCAKDHQPITASKETALRTLEYLGNVSATMNYSREGKLIIINRGRRDLATAKDLLYEMHEFIRSWLHGFEGTSYTADEDCTRESRRKSAASVRPLRSASPAKARNETAVNDDTTFVEGTSEYDLPRLAAEQQKNLLSQKTPGILLSLPPQLATLFDEKEISELMNSAVGK
ncbi:hypothetical protein HDU82_000720 [Entophlyctis luteolus]|nr:hypothetical protein HDU82_000720 [Entophlyctis luteolus]